MKIHNQSTALIAALGLLLFAGQGMAATAVLNSSNDTLTVTGYANSASGGKLQTQPITWYSGSGYGMTSSGESSASPNHALDNNGNREALLLDFGASTQLTGVTVGWTGGYDSDITVLAYRPQDYMSSAINPASIAAPTLAGKTYAELLGLGWMLVGNYQNVQEGVTKTVNGGSNPVSSSYWLVMSYNSLIGAAPSASSDTSARSFAADGSYDYGKFYSVSYNPGTTTTTNRVPEPPTALLLGMALFGMIGLGNRRLARR